MPGLVGRLDERLEVVRGAVARLDGERMGRVVAPRPLAGELERRHELDRADAEVPEVLEATPDAVERAGPAVHSRR